MRVAYSISSRLYRSCRRDGLARVAGSSLLAARERLAKRRRPVAAPPKASGSFDARFNVDTSGKLGTIEALAGIESPNWNSGVPYQTTSEDVFEGLMETCSVRHEEFVFVDLGSGKGKALMLAAGYPFQKIIGVEYCRPLHETALRNMAMYRNPAMKCKDIHCLCEDATKFEIPPQPCVFHMFNPFGPTIVDAVAQNMLQSRARHSRPMYVLYSNALHADVFRRLGFVELAAYAFRGEDQIVLRAP